MVLLGGLFWVRGVCWGLTLALVGKLLGLLTTVRALEVEGLPRGIMDPGLCGFWGLYWLVGVRGII